MVRRRPHLAGTRQYTKRFLLQCSECVDNFMGTPTGGHQCYRQMSVDRDYCFDPDTQMNCNTEQLMPLYKGRTVFFVVQPKYLNVDIRILLDVTKGGKLLCVHFMYVPPTCSFHVIAYNMFFTALFIAKLSSYPPSPRPTKKTEKRIDFVLGNMDAKMIFRQ